MGIEEVRGSLEDMSRELEHKIKSALEDAKIVSALETALQEANQVARCVPFDNEFLNHYCQQLDDTMAGDEAL